MEKERQGWPLLVGDSDDDFSLHLPIAGERVQGDIGMEIRTGVLFIVLLYSTYPSHGRRAFLLQTTNQHVRYNIREMTTKYLRAVL